MKSVAFSIRIFASLEFPRLEISSLSQLVICLGFLSEMFLLLRATFSCLISRVEDGPRVRMMPRTRITEETDSTLGGMREMTGCYFIRYRHLMIGNNSEEKEDFSNEESWLLSPSPATALTPVSSNLFKVVSCSVLLTPLRISSRSPENFTISDSQIKLHLGNKKALLK